MRSVYDAIKALVTLRPQAITANANGISVDTQGYNSAAVILEVGAVSGTNPTLDVKLQESADGSTWADISGATFAQVTAANNSQILRVEGLGTSRKRYIRAVATVGGTSPSFNTACEVLLGRAYKEPVN
ncbi:MAG: hypothetical protein KatS3mg101_1073 [Patescibacteria group bacterium]|nr:MAG: hypothetical protein KatS3mg101_1073 [Patescibacteria group bacterium]